MTMAPIVRFTFVLVFGLAYHVECFGSSRLRESPISRLNRFPVPSASRTRGTGGTQTVIFVSPPSVRKSVDVGDSQTDGSDESKKPTDNEEESFLSDVDARVLREMLSESKLDLETEDDIRKLLERGFTKKRVDFASPGKQQEPKKDSVFESTLFKTFAETKLWQAISAKTSDFFESTKLWLENKIERDVKTIAALGMFAWDRVVRDVARALPATAATAVPKIFIFSNTSSLAQKSIFLLGNVSSFSSTTESTAESLRQELNRPADEIKQVSEAIWDILSGRATDGSPTVDSGRALRTVAKAGVTNMADRQRRAFRQQRKKREQESLVQGIQKLPGSMADVAHELQQELKAETNPAGYKTKDIRQKALAASVAIGNTAGKYLEAFRESNRWRLAGENGEGQKKTMAIGADATLDPSRIRKTKEPPKTSETSKSTQSSAYFAWDWYPEQSVVVNDEATYKTAQVAMESTAAVPSVIQDEELADVSTTDLEAQLLCDLQVEREAMVTRLLTCIYDPKDTWLQYDSLADESRTLSEESLRDVATFMILLKDELNTTSLESSVASSNGEETVETYLEQLRRDLRLIERLRATVATTISVTIGNKLYDIIVGKYDMLGSGEEPVLLRLDEIEREWKELTRLPTVQNAPRASEPFFVDAKPRQPASSNEYSGSTVHMPPDVARQGHAEGRFVGRKNQSFRGAAEVPTARENWINGEEWPTETIKYLEVENDDDIPVVITQGSGIKVGVVDVVPESIFRGQPGLSVSIGDDAVVVDSVTGSVFIAEVVSDDDFEIAVGEQRAVAAASDEDGEASKPNYVLMTVLRSLDVAFFVLEKIFIVAVPNAILLVSTAAKRLDEVNQGGKGKKGWDTIRNTCDPKGRY